MATKPKKPEPKAIVEAKARDEAAKKAAEARPEKVKKDEARGLLLAELANVAARTSNPEIRKVVELIERLFAV